jgi:hypothetical protein
MMMVIFKHACALWLRGQPSFTRDEARRIAAK